MSAKMAGGTGQDQKFYLSFQKYESKQAHLACLCRTLIVLTAFETGAYLPGNLPT